MAKKNVEYRISLEDKFTRALKKADRGVDSFEKKVMRAGKTIASFLAGAVIVRATVNLSKKILKLGTDLEQSEIAFETFLGSAEKGKKLLTELQEFANVTPFTNVQVIQSARSLLAYNVEAEKLIPTIKALGDIAAGVGLIKMPNLILAFGQVRAATRLTGMELRQFTEAGVPMLDELSKIMNLPVKVIKEDLIPAGDVPFALVEQALINLTEKGGKFYNLMSKQAKSAAGMWSVFVGKMQLGGMELGKKFLPVVKKTTKGLIELADKFIKITRIPLSKKLESERTEFVGLITSLNDINKSEDDRLKILKEIRDISPELVKGIKKEGEQYTISAEKLRKFNQQQLNRIVIAKKQEAIESFKEKARKAGEKAQDALVKIQEKRAQAIFKISDKNKKDGELVQEILMGNINTETTLGELRKKYGEETAWLLNQAGLQTSKNQKEFIAAQNIAIQSIARRNGLTIEEIGLNDEFFDLIRKFNPLFNAQNRANLTANNLRKEAIKLAKALGVELEGNLLTEGLITAVPGDELKAGITTIKSAAPKTFNINITKLIENFSISTENITETAEGVQEKIVEAMSLALADIQAVAR